MADDRPRPRNNLGQFTRAMTPAEQDRLEKAKEQRDKEQVVRENKQIVSTDKLSDTIEEMGEQFSEMHKNLDKLAPTTDKLTEYIEGTKKQFAEMHKSIDGLHDATEEHTETVKLQTKETKKQTKQDKAEELTTKDEVKEQKLLLKEMQLQLRRTQMQEGATMADVAAEHLAGGGGLLGAGKAAAGLKVAQLKHRFDPLNIVKKMTGGSKLAVALAGKVMGRKESTIREFADLAPGQELPTSIFGKGAKYGSPSEIRGESRSTGVGGKDTSGVLDTIAGTLAKIHDRLTNIETIERLTAKLTQDQIDTARDTAAEEGAKRKPSRVGVIVSKAKDMGSDVLKFVTDLVKKIKLGLVGAFIGLGVAAGMLIKQWKNLKLSFTLLKESAVEMWQGLKNAFSDAGKWISDKATEIKDTFQGLMEDMLETVKGFIGQGSTPEEKQAKLEARAKAGDQYAVRKRSSRTEITTKLAATEEETEAVKKLAPGFTSKIPTEGKESTAEGLKRGVYDAAATDSLLGKAAPSGTPQQKATVGAITQLATKAYGEIFKDAQGNPLTPSTDKDMAAKRVPTLVKAASMELARSLGAVPSPTLTPTTAPAPVAATVIGAPQALPPAMPTQGMELNRSAEARRDAEEKTIGGIVAPSATVNRTVHNNSVTTIHQGMAPSRSGESSHIRAFDKNFVPA